MNQKNNIQNPIFSKGDIFSDYLNCNNLKDPIINQEFSKPTIDAFDKYFIEDYNNNSPKLSSISSNEYNKSANYNRSNPITPKREFIHNNQFLLNNNNKNKQNFNFNNDNNNFYLNHLDASNGAITDSIDNNSILTKKSIKKTKNLKKNLLFKTSKRNKTFLEEIKEKKLAMNRESAKKSRLKKKLYIEKLEKEFKQVKEELDEYKKMKQKFYEDNNNLNIDNIQKLKIEENNIIKNNLEKNNEVINNYILNQKQILKFLLIKQIDVITPIKIKIFQNKFLKLKDIEKDDDIEVIKNKIEANLVTINELYDIETIDNKKGGINICNKNNSMAYQIYSFYISLKMFVSEFETIYSKINNV